MTRPTKRDYPGAPLDSYVCPEGWLVVGDQAWTVEEWNSTDSAHHKGRGGRPGRPRRYPSDRERRRAEWERAKARRAVA